MEKGLLMGYGERAAKVLGWKSEEYHQCTLWEIPGKLDTTHVFDKIHYSSKELKFMYLRDWSNLLIDHAMELHTQLVSGPIEELHDRVMASPYKVSPILAFGRQLLIDHMGENPKCWKTINGGSPVHEIDEIGILFHLAKPAMVTKVMVDLLEV